MFSKMILGSVWILGMGAAVGLHSHSMPSSQYAHQRHMHQSNSKMQGTNHQQKKSKSRLPVLVKSGQVIAVPSGIKETTVIATIHNQSNKAIQLNSVRSEIAGHGMLMITTKNKKGMMGMKMVPQLVVPAQGVLKLKTDGDHLMLGMLKRQLRIGEVLKVTIGDTTGREMSFKALVKKP